MLINVNLKVRARRPQILNFPFHATSQGSPEYYTFYGALIPHYKVAHMIRNYLKIAWRNLVKNKVYSFINIGGLAVGMAVAVLIGLWIYDELTYDRYHSHYHRIAQVMQHQTWNGEIGT